MESYEDDLTTLDVQNIIRYLQINSSHDPRDSNQAGRGAFAWLDDRFLDRVVPQELSGSLPTMAGENDSLQAHQNPRLVDGSEVASTHPVRTDTLNNNECNTTDVAVEINQTASHTEYNIAYSSINLHGARSARRYTAPLTADLLHGYLRERQFDHTKYLDADRRLIYIADPDASYISALIRNARAHQMRSLQDTICKYFAQDTSIKVSISEGCTEYQLEFHIPYLALRYRPLQGFPERKDRIHRGWMNIDFLGKKSIDAGPDSICGAHHAQISLTICGTDNSRWTAYCFETRYFDEDGEIGGDEQTDNHQSDHIARGKFGAEDTIHDPREYFIRVLLIRMRQVHTERMKLKRRIELGIKEHSSGRFFFSTARDGIPHDIHDIAASDWIEPTVQLLEVLLDDIANMKDAWTRFTSDIGDMAYFSDICSSPRISKTFVQLSDVFSEMMDLEKKLRHILGQCEQRRQTVNLRLASDSKRNAELTVYFISPFAIVSTFFSIPVPIIGFDRNILSFSIAIVLYIVVLQALLFVWGGGFSQQPWWNKISRIFKTLRGGDAGFTEKNEGRARVLQRKTTSESVV
jgi:hypothetical protein